MGEVTEWVRFSTAKVRILAVVPAIEFVSAWTNFGKFLSLDVRFTIGDVCLNLGLLEVLR